MVTQGIQAIKLISRPLILYAIFQHTQYIVYNQITIFLMDGVRIKEKQETTLVTIRSDNLH